ncbi:hypothetical protein, partial [Bacillus cereus]|uniref:hypothetical protein n=1 Tax=Bacillus cereus TaxID=1396 RepID=UPI002ABFC212
KLVSLSSKIKIDVSGCLFRSVFKQLFGCSFATSLCYHLRFSMSTKFFNFFFVVFCVSASATVINISW